jgi:hypothetical protein
MGCTNIANILASVGYPAFAIKKCWKEKYKICGNYVLGERLDWRQERWSSSNAGIY